jgi:Tol biopolymer transport system component
MNDCSGLFEVDLGTGTAVLLKECPAGAEIRWVELSPEGETLFYELMDDTGEQPIRLKQYDMHTRQEKELLRENSWPVCPSLSPDGKWLSFVTFDSERQARNLNVMPASGGSIRQIVSFEEYEAVFTSDWMPDGKSILYVKKLPGRTGRRELCQVYIEGGDQRTIGVIADYATHLRIHPDGRRIAFGDYKLQTEVWVMENFLPKD